MKHLHKLLVATVGWRNVDPPPPPPLCVSLCPFAPVETELFLSAQTESTEWRRKQTQSRKMGAK